MPLFWSCHPLWLLPVSALVMLVQRKENYVGLFFFFFFFTPKVFLIVQIGGLNISNKPVFWGFYIAVDNL